MSRTEGEKMEILNLSHWMKNLAEDVKIYQAYRQCVVSSTSTRDRIFYLDMMAIARRCIRIDRAQCLSILRDMSLCADHEKESHCTCKPPF